jgi:exopolysaccharide biosynthesis WecB/TagA/CpsF family protein
MSDVLTAEVLDQASRVRKTVFSVAISDLARDEALTFLHGAMAQRLHVKLAFCNAHTANIAWNNEQFRTLLKGFTVFADGLGIDLAAKVLYGAPFAANLNGTDFVPELLRTSVNPLKIALVGGKPGIAEAAARQIMAITPRHSVTTVMHGFSTQAETAAYLGQLETAPVDVLLVAMGNPRQEQWIAHHIDGRHAKLAIGVGALFDFMAGAVPRAPQWVQHLRLEWLYRLAQEPRRLAGRYLLGNPRFLLRVVLVKLGIKRF